MIVQYPLRGVCTVCGDIVTHDGHDDDHSLKACRDRLAARLATAVEALTEIAGLDAVEILHRPSVPIARASEALAAISATGGKETR